MHTSRLRMIAQRRTPPPCFSSRAYSLRGDRAVPFRSLWPPGASQKICITTGPGQPLTASTMIPDISRHETTNMNAAHISIWEKEKSSGMGRRPGAQCCLCFRSLGRPNSNCTALELWLQFIASRVLPPQTSARMLSSSGLPD